jgi:hypothetical protein
MYSFGFFASSDTGTGFDQHPVFVTIGVVG